MATKTTRLDDAYRNGMFYTELPPGRQPVGTAVTKDQWKRFVEGLVSSDGLTSVDLFDEIRVGSPEWREKLRNVILTNGWRMWWETKPPVPKDKLPRTIENLFGTYPQGTPEYTAWIAEDRAQRRRRNARESSRRARRRQRT